MSEYRRVDVVVHCAGVLGPLEALGDTPIEPWMEAFVRSSPNRPSPTERLMRIP